MLALGRRIETIPAIIRLRFSLRQLLVGVVLGSDPRDRKIILRTHMLMGQVYFFAMSREAILRRLGWMTLEGKNADLVTDLLEENLEALFSGLARTGTGEFPGERSGG